jgi:LacI family transcriptional regulator, repressor for deo operon, udp, cdd, tsx, nupC, and nupG
MSGKRPATIEDVARIAGVSIATVSRAVHMPEKVAKATRQAINKAILVTGYQANAMARSLRTGRTDIILVLTPDIGDPNFAPTLIGIENEARARHYAILTGHTQDDPQRHVDYLRLLSSHKLAGLLLFTGTVPLEGLATSAIPPIVSVFEPSDDAGHPYVGVDDRMGARKATEHLLAAGHRRIAFVGNSLARLSVRRRRSGFDQAMDAARIPPVDRIIVDGDGSIESGRHAVELLFIRDDLPTAFMCSSDLAAIGVMNGLAARGYSVPRDFSVIGFDDVPQATFANPPLTTIRQPRNQIGRTAIELLIDMIEGSPPEAERDHLIVPELVVRGSVTAPSPHPG